MIVLMYNKDVLLEGNKLCDYGIQNESTVHLVNRVPIFVKLPTGKMIKLRVQTEDTINIVKAMLAPFVVHVFKLLFSITQQLI